MPRRIFILFIKRNTVSVSSFGSSLHRSCSKGFSCLPTGFHQLSTATGGWVMRGKCGTHSPDSFLPGNSLVVVLKAVAPVQ